MQLSKVILAAGIVGMLSLPLSLANAQQGRGQGRSGAAPGRAAGAAAAAAGSMSKAGGAASKSGNAETKRRNSEEHGKPADAPRGQASGPREGTGQPTPLDILEKNPRAIERVRALLPEGVDPLVAAEGFKNYGQFMAAVHVSHNLDIPFEEIRARMLDGQSLGQAIHELRPELNEEQAVVRAEAQVRVEEKELTQVQTPQ